MKKKNKKKKSYEILTKSNFKIKNWLEKKKNFDF